MCGRYNLTATPESIAEHFELPRFNPSYNITPAQKLLCIVQLDDQSLKSVNLFWGLVPSWSKDDKNCHRLINARAETIREKPSFRAAFHKRRCLIVANGFYEWQKLESHKQAFHIHRQDNQLFAFAGCLPKQGEVNVTAVIQAFDRETRCVKTANGVIYQLVGQPGLDDLVEVVWEQWKNANAVINDVDVTHQYCWTH